MQKVKALILFSGGLDSVLAVKLLQIQNIEVEGICFTSNFFGCAKAKKAAEEIGIKLNIVDISKELLDIVKNPQSGYGKNLNPCIDCHSLMLKKASVYLTPQPPLLIRRGGGAERRGRGNIIATGEVLGQRPFSQNKEALARIEKIAGVEILRPLSAKLLPETAYEKQGLVNRGRLLNIRGRSRERQTELIEKYKLKNYSSPAGGCLLTDPEFSNRLMKMLDYWPDCDVNDVELLKHGRIFWLKTRIDINLKQIHTNYKKALIVVGRHEEDNENLEKLARRGDVLLELGDIAGPITVIRKFEVGNLKFGNLLKIDVPEKLRMGELKFGDEKNFEEILNIAGLLTGWYAVKARGKKIKIKLIKL